MWLASHKAGLQSDGHIDGTRSTLRRQFFDVLCRSELFEEPRSCGEKEVMPGPRRAGTATKCIDASLFFDVTDSSELMRFGDVV